MKRLHFVIIFVGLYFFISGTMAQSACEDCSDFGVCINENDNGTCGECICPEYFSGECCTIPHDTCSLNPCSSSSSQYWICTNLGPGKRSCACEEGFTGAKCDTSMDECDMMTCFNGGTCSVAGVNGTECICTNDFNGTYCENSKKCGFVIANPCPCKSNPCKNGATCVETSKTAYKCQCAEGYTGTTCNTKICGSLNCQNGGVCVANAAGVESCDCLSIWEGNKCKDFKACNYYKCQNGGTCKATGKQATCTCVNGWTGNHCETMIDNCDPNPCLYKEWGITNETTCNNLLGNYTCDCPVGSGGKNCSINLDDCNPSARGGGSTLCNTQDKTATCLDGLNAYKCTCSPDYTGVTCKTSMIVWNVAQQFGGLDDLVDLLEEVVKNPSLIKDLMPFLLGQQDIESQSAMSWDFDDLFVWASYEKNELDLRKDFHKTYDTTLGNCFTFNHATTPKQWTSRKSGEDGGFKALIKVRQDQYLSWYDTASLLVFVHPSEENIFAESVRYQAAPNTSTTLISTKNAYSRLNGKYGTCVKSVDEVGSYYYNGSYTTAGCFRGCYQDAVFKKCNCMDPRYAMSTEATPCNITMWDCVNSITRDLGDASNWPSCICPSPCSESQFDSAFMKASFPSYYSPCDQFDNDTDKYGYCMGNYTDMVLLSVYIPRLTQKVFAETPAMSFNQFISSVGGLAGVIIGFSIITLFDIAFIFVYLAWSFCGKSSAKKD